MSGNAVVYIFMTDEALESPRILICIVVIFFTFCVVNKIVRVKKNIKRVEPVKLP